MLWFVFDKLGFALFNCDESLKIVEKKTQHVHMLGPLLILETSAHTRSRMRMGQVRIYKCSDVTCQSTTPISVLSGQNLPLPQVLWRWIEIIFSRSGHKSCHLRPRRVVSAHPRSKEQSFETDETAFPRL